MNSLLRLGIDTGGTYTDAVLVDHGNRILASAKRLTTHHELTTGIGEALDELPAERLGDVCLVALSTTLSTNAVVEGRGAHQAGAEDVEVSVDQAANHIHHDIDGDLFLESQVIATATGRPALGG